MRRSRLATGGVSVLAVMATILTVPDTAAAQPPSTGVVVGIVVDASTSAPLPGAVVTVENTRLSAAAGRNGQFEIAGVPAGAATLVVSYLGHESARSTVTVPPGQLLQVEVALQETLVVRETVTVSGTPVQEGQARALNRQRTAPNIVNVISADQIGQFPDANAAEAAQRVPGVTIERDQGEGRYVAIRGTEPRLNSMMINGERIPSPEGDIRAVALDVVPTDLLETIEVTKAVTPDMDADAIGGAVNLITRDAPDRPRVFGAVSGGYNRLMEDFAQSGFNATGGRRFNDGRVGLLVTGSAQAVNRGSDNIEPEYDDGDLDVLELRDYTVGRERYGLNGTFDYQLAPGNALTIRGIYNNFSDQEYRRLVANAVGDDEIEWELKDRLEEQVIGSLAAAGRHLLRGGVLFDYTASFARSKEDEPGAYYTIFTQEDVDFDPNVTPGFIDPDDIQANPVNLDVQSALFDEQSIEDNLTTDRDLVAAANLRIPLRTSASLAGSMKVGVKHRQKRKRRDNGTLIFETDADIFMGDLLESGFNPRNFYRGRYAFGPFFDPDAARALNGRAGFESSTDLEADLADYDATENVTAGYAMADLAAGPRLTVLAGVRVETTGFDYTGYDLTFDEEGNFATLTEVSGTGRYTQVLPGAHLRYAITPDSNIRAAVTRTLARPNYYDLVPYQLVLEEDLEIERGNPMLQPSTSWNVDVLAERYFRSVGIVSGGFFYKSIADFIFPFRFEESRSSDDYDVVEPRNGPTASVAGIELALQNQLRFLPAPFDGLGVYANYTFTDSDAELPDRTAERLQLPGQVRHSGNLAVWYEKAGFSTRMAVTFRNAFLAEVGGDADEDLFVDTHHQLDLSVSHAITPRIRLFADVLNLTNQPLRVYEATSDRPIQEEYYRWWMMFGARFGF